MEITLTNRFRKDVTRMKRRQKDMRKLKVIMSTLADGKPLAARHRNHKLSGNYNGRWECHIEPDWLLSRPCKSGQRC